MKHNDLERRFVHTNPKPDGVSPHAPAREPEPPQGGSGVKEQEPASPRDGMNRKEWKALEHEERRYAELRGKNVVVVLGADHQAQELSPLLHGVLRWVSRYNIGVYVELGAPGRTGQVWIVNKAKIVMIGEA